MRKLAAQVRPIRSWCNMYKSTVKLRDWKHKPPQNVANSGEVKRDANGRFVKGTARLPNSGRQRGMTLSDAVRNKLKEYINDRVDAPTWAELIADVMINEATVKRNGKAWAELRELTESRKFEIVDPRLALQKRLAELGLSIEDVRHDPIVAGFFRSAGIDITDNSASVGSDSSDEE